MIEGGKGTPHQIPAHLKRAPALSRSLQDLGSSRRGGFCLTCRDGSRDTGKFEGE